MDAGGRASRKDSIGATQTGLLNFRQKPEGWCHTFGKLSAQPRESPFIGLQTIPDMNWRADRCSQTKHGQFGTAISAWALGSRELEIGNAVSREHSVPNLSDLAWASLCFD